MAALKDKVQNALDESRILILGAQVFIGFQFALILMEGFERLPVSSRYLHLLSLVLITLSTILLMTPAADHRIVEQGEETEHFYCFASRVLLAAMMPLAVGIAGDFFVVGRIVTGSVGFAFTTAVLLLGCCYSLWFGYTFYRCQQRR